MAKCDLSGLICRIRGSVGGMTFSAYKGMIRLSKKVGGGRRSCTTSQKRVREVFRELNYRWNNMSFSECNLWEAYSREYGKIRKRSRSGLIHCMGGGFRGKDAYISLNSVLVLSGFSPLEKPPFNCRGRLPSLKADLIDCGDYEEKVRFHVWLSSSYESQCVCQVWVRKIAMDCHPYIGAIVPLSLTPTEVVIDKIRFKHKSHYLEKSFRSIGRSKVQIQLRGVSSNGLISLPSSVYQVMVK